MKRIQLVKCVKCKMAPNRMAKSKVNLTVGVEEETIVEVEVTTRTRAIAAMTMMMIMVLKRLGQLEMVSKGTRKNNNIRKKEAMMVKVATRDTDPSTKTSIRTEVRKTIETIIKTEETHRRANIRKSVTRTKMQEA